MSEDKELDVISKIGYAIFDLNNWRKTWRKTMSEDKELDVVKKISYAIFDVTNKIIEAEEVDMSVAYTAHMLTLLALIKAAPSPVAVRNAIIKKLQEENAEEIKEAISNIKSGDINEDKTKNQQ